MTAPAPDGGAGEAAARRDRIARLKGIALMASAVACFSVLDGGAKWLGREMPALQVTFARYAVAFLIILVVVNPVSHPRAWSTRRPLLQGLRGLALFGSTFCNFMAIRTLQLSEAVAIIFATPFVIAALSGPVLGERMDRRRWAAVVVGFLGVLVVTRPSLAGVKPGVAWSLAGVLCYAFYSITTRILSRSDSAASMLVISALIPTVALAPVMPGIWVWPSDGFGWLAIGLMGSMGVIGHFFLIRAYTHAPVPVVSPFLYTQVVWSTLVGFVVFGDLPGLSTVVGGGIVVGSGLYLIWLETRRRPG